MVLNPRRDEAEEERPGKKARPVEVKKEQSAVIKPEGRPASSPMDITDNEFKQAFANAPGARILLSHA